MKKKDQDSRQPQTVTKTEELVEQLKFTGLSGSLAIAEILVASQVIDITNVGFSPESILIPTAMLGLNALVAAKVVFKDHSKKR